VPDTASASHARVGARVPVRVDGSRGRELRKRIATGTLDRAGPAERSPGEERASRQQQCIDLAGRVAVPRDGAGGRERRKANCQCRAETFWTGRPHTRASRRRPARKLCCRRCRFPADCAGRDQQGGEPVRGRDGVDRREVASDIDPRGVRGEGVDPPVVNRWGPGGRHAGRSAHRGDAACGAPRRRSGMRHPDTASARPARRVSACTSPSGSGAKGAMVPSAKCAPGCAARLRRRVRSPPRCTTPPVPSARTAWMDPPRPKTSGKVTSRAPLERASDTPDPVAGPTLVKLPPM